MGVFLLCSQRFLHDLRRDGIESEVAGELEAGERQRAKEEALRHIGRMLAATVTFTIRTLVCVYSSAFFSESSLFVLTACERFFDAIWLP